MINEKTLFILGAGASCPYKYPTGKELRRLIYEEFPSRYKKLSNQINSSELGISRSVIHDDIQLAPRFADNFFKSSTPSIDLFLARNPNFSKIGKKAIALSLWIAEQKSCFREKVDQNQDWYSYLYQRMTETLTKPDSYKQINQNKISFITFNYDRSLEFFLYESLINSFNLEYTANYPYSDLLPFSIQHVYGQLSTLPCQKQSSLAYRLAPNIKTLQKLCSNIRVIYDRTDENLMDIKKEISAAKRIFFLGFGFAKENIDVLDIPNLLTDKHQIYGTAFGMTNKEILRVRSQLSQNFKNKDPVLHNPRIKNMNCYEILREYL